MENETAIWLGHNTLAVVYIILSLWGFVYCYGLSSEKSRVANKKRQRKGKTK